MALGLLVGSAIMVGLAVAVVLVTMRARGWYSYTPQHSREAVGWDPAAGTDPGGGILSRPGTWILAFFVVATLGIGGVFLFATGSVGGSAALLGLVVALVAANVVGGVYLVARQRGHSNAMAVMESATASGMVFLVLVVVQLVALG